MARTLIRHRDIRIVEFLEEGPANARAFASAYKETLPAGDPLPTSATWYTDSSKAEKICEKVYTYDGAFPTTITWKLYDEDGTTVIATVVDAITYDGAFELTRTRTVT